MAASLANLNDLRTALGRLNAERPATGVEIDDTTLYADRGDSFRKRMDLEVDGRQGKARVLVTGQIGVGKSSELYRFVWGRRNVASGWVVYCDLEKQEHPERCGATGVLLAMMRDCWATTQQIPHGRIDLKRIRDRCLDDLTDMLKGQREPDGSSIVFKFGGMSFSVDQREDRRDAGLGLLLGKAAQHEAVSDPGERFGVIPDQLRNSFNALLQWFAARSQDRAPLIVVDHVDKIRDPSAAEEVLLKAFPQWHSLRCSIVMTAPYEYTLGELRNSIESKWGKPIMVYPVPIPEEHAGDIPSIYLSIAMDARISKLNSSPSNRQ